MRVFYIALSMLFFFSGYARAQSIGEHWSDKTGLFVHCRDNVNLLLSMEDHHFKVIFLDDADTVIGCPFRRMILRADNRANKKKDLLLVFHSDPGAAILTHTRFIKPPYVYEVHIILYPEEEGDAGKIVIPALPFSW